MLRLPIWGAQFEEQHPGPSWMVTPRSSHWGDSAASLVPAHPLPVYLFTADSSELVLSTARNPWETSASAPSLQAELAAELGWVLEESGGVRKAPCICLAKRVTASPGPAEGIWSKYLGLALVCWSALVSLPPEPCSQPHKHGWGPDTSPSPCLLAPLPSAWIWHPPSPFRQGPGNAPSGGGALCLSDLEGYSHTYAHPISWWTLPGNNTFITSLIITEMPLRSLYLAPL